MGQIWEKIYWQIKDLVDTHLMCEYKKKLWRRFPTIFDLRRKWWFLADFQSLSLFWGTLGIFWEIFFASIQRSYSVGSYNLSPDSLRFKLRRGDEKKVKKRPMQEKRLLRENSSSHPCSVIRCSCFPKITRISSWDEMRLNDKDGPVFVHS